MSKTENKIINKFCKVPFEFVDISYPPENLVMPCCWMNKAIGSLSNGANFADIWNSEAAQDVRSSILDGTFRYCIKESCPHIHNGTLPDKQGVKEDEYRRIIDNNIIKMSSGPKTLHLNNDKSCNLSCPSCRTSKNLIVSGPEFEKRKVLLEDLLATGILNEVEEISVTGAGDPFASKIYRDFLVSLDGKKYPKIKINLFTNGVLFNEKMWNSMSKTHRNIQDVKVSLDAANRDTYNIVRRGGDMVAALDNLKFLSQKKSEGFFRDLVMCFVVQNLNYREMKDFVKIALELRNVKVHFQRITNWGTFTDDEFLKHAVYLPEHENYNDFLECLKDPILKNQIVDLGNLNEFT